MPSSINLSQPPTNGHTRGNDGRLIGCSHGDRCIKRTGLDDTVTVLVDRYERKRLNSPNDLVVKRDGTIWLSDPVHGIVTGFEGGKRESALAANLYRFDPRAASLTIVADDFASSTACAFRPTNVCSMCRREVCRSPPTRYSTCALSTWRATAAAWPTRGSSTK